MAKRKYTRSGEKFIKSECSNRKCKWQGVEGEKAEKYVSENETHLACPICGNVEFHGLII